MPEKSIEHRDIEAEKYDADASLLEPSGEPRRMRQRPQKLGGAVPIRFTPDTIARIKRIADEEGVTVSVWVRSEVERALSRREAKAVIVKISSRPAFGPMLGPEQGRRRLAGVGA